MILDCQFYHLDTAFYAKFFQNMADMRFNRRAAHVQSFSNFRIAEPIHQQVQNCALARVKSCPGVDGCVVFWIKNLVASGASVGRPACAARMAPANSSTDTFLYK